MARKPIGLTTYHGATIKPASVALSTRKVSLVSVPLLLISQVGIARRPIHKVLKRLHSPCDSRMHSVSTPTATNDSGDGQCENVFPPPPLIRAMRRLPS